MIFQWDTKNTDHIARHGVEPREAEQIVTRAMPPFPKEGGDDKLVVWGGTEGGRYLQVIFVPKDPEEVAAESLTVEDRAALSDGAELQVIRVIHAMDLSEGMLKQYLKLRSRR